MKFVYIYFIFNDRVQCIQWCLIKAILVQIYKTNDERTFMDVTHRIITHPHTGQSNVNSLMFLVTLRCKFCLFLNVFLCMFQIYLATNQTHIRVSTTVNSRHDCASCMFLFIKTIHLNEWIIFLDHFYLDHFFRALSLWIIIIKLLSPLDEPEPFCFAFICLKNLCFYILLVLNK